MNVGVVAPSSVVSQVELALGIERLEGAGFSVRLNPQCRKKHRFFAGTDEQRAEAFFDYCSDSSLQIVYCARGGYGAARILPLLERKVRERGVPSRKLLVGSSDATALLEYVRTRWGWSTLHSPMPGLRNFSTMTKSEFEGLTSWMRAEFVKKPWDGKKLRVLRKGQPGGIRGELVGGNLTVWATLLGTPYAGKPHGKILFFEDIGEKLYRLDRMITQVELAGGFQGVRGIILGDYKDCDDAVATGLKKLPSAAARARMLKAPKPSEIGPLRPLLPPEKTISEMFLEVAERHQIPLVAGLPVGHGPGHHSLPLGAEYRLGTDGRLELLNWNWTK